MMKSIRMKIAMLLFGSVLFSSVIIGAMGVAATAKVVGQNANEQMNLLCRLNAGEMDLVLAKIEDSVNTLAHYAQQELSDASALQDDAYRDQYTANIEKSARHHIEKVEGAQAVYVLYDPALVHGVEGFFWVKEGTEFTKEPLTDISQYEKDDLGHVGFWYEPVAKGSAVWLDAYHNENIDRHIVSYVVPMYKEGVLIGVIGADISSDYIESLVKNISFLTSGKAAVLESDGTVLYHPRFERGVNLGQNNPAFAGVVEELTRQDQTEEPISYSMNGVDKRIVGCKLKNGMLLACYAPVSEIYAEQTVLATFIIAVIAGVTAVALLLSALLSSRLTKPIKKLNRAAKHLTEGDFEIDIDCVGNDEIGELARTFVETRKILKRQFELLESEAHRDGLTGVANKSAFLDTEEMLNGQIAAGSASFAVAVFDVNMLKITNDIFGHMAGDKLLTTVSGHLAAHFDTTDIYRVGGDEFVVVVTEEKEADFGELVEKCIADMKSLSVEGYPQCRVSCAYGVTHFDPDRDRNVSDVLRNADKEMYKNKTLSKQETFPWQEGAKGLKSIQIEKYCELLKTLCASTDDCLFLLNTETCRVRFFGKDWKYAGGGKEDFRGLQDVLSGVHPNDKARVEHLLMQVLNHETEEVNLNFRLQNSDGPQWVNCRGNIVKDDADNRFVMIGRLSQNAIKHLYNPVTALFNKTKLEQDLKTNSTCPFAYLLLVDIDDLSDINLRHGSGYGNMLLKTLAGELESRFDMHRVYHAEKDHFLVLLDSTTAEEAQKVFADLKSVLQNKCSMSAAVLPNDKALYESAENIYNCAVQILHISKRGNPGQVAFFSQESLSERMLAIELLEELEDSVEKGCSGFYLVYQPQIRTQDYSVFAAEALLRYSSETKGVIGPDRFIPILEKTGLINDVGIWVVDQALAQCKKWRQAVPNLCVSVNLSPIQLKRKRTAAQIIGLLEEHGLPGSALILEITETAQLDDDEEAMSALEKMKQAGIRIAIDDFGTGYSNLGNLKQIQVDILKVDRIFVKDIKENGYNYNLIHNIIEFAKANAITVCLEGVENTDELFTLDSLKPDVIQGYLFDKPCTPEELENKYILQDTEAFAQRMAFVKQLHSERKHTPVIRMDTKIILSGIDIGLWILCNDIQTGHTELYTDSTLRRLLGVDDKINPADCYDYWYGNIKHGHEGAVNTMLAEMTQSDKVIQGEYQWNHPEKGEVTVRCTGRCIEQTDGRLVFEGFLRLIGDMGKSR